MIPSYNNFKKSRGADISSRGGITSATTAHGGPPDGSISNENRSGHSGREHILQANNSINYPNNINNSYSEKRSHL